MRRETTKSGAVDKKADMNIKSRVTENQKKWPSMGILRDGRRNDSLQPYLPLVMDATSLSVRNDRNYRIGELFAGAGGMTLGAHLAGYSGHQFLHVWVNDVDRDACETLKANIPLPSEGSRCCRVEDLDLVNLPDIDGLAFGFPCNDFSVVGRRTGLSGKYGCLYRWGVKALKVKRPSFFVAENVGGLSYRGGGLPVIMDALRDAGYDLFPSIYRFEHYGVPQNRHRIIIVGFRSDLAIRYNPPMPTTKDSPVTVAEALADIPDWAENQELTRQSAQVVERLRHIRPGENAFNADLPEHLRLRLKSGASISLIYRRLRPDKPSYTVTASGGGGTHVYHWSEPRALTNRERARLQTFPDSFVFLGGKESVRRQIGMAVPPLGAKAIFKSVLETLVKYDVCPI